MMSAATTAAAERMANQQLSQDRVLALMAGGRGGSGAGRITVNQNFTFHGGFSSAEKEWFRKEARAQAVSAITAVVGAA